MLLLPPQAGALLLQVGPGPAPQGPRLLPLLLPVLLGGAPRRPPLPPATHEVRLTPTSLELEPPQEHEERRRARHPPHHRPRPGRPRPRPLAPFYTLARSLNRSQPLPPIYDEMIKVLLCAADYTVHCTIDSKYRRNRSLDPPVYNIPLPEPASVESPSPASGRQDGGEGGVRSEARLHGHQGGRGEQRGHQPPHQVAGPARRPGGHRALTHWCTDFCGGRKFGMNSEKCIIKN